MLISEPLYNQSKLNSDGPWATLLRYLGLKCLAKGQFMRDFLKDERVPFSTLPPHLSCNSTVGCHQDMCLNHVVWLWIDGVAYVSVHEGVWTGCVWQHLLVLYVWASARQILAYADNLAPPYMTTQFHWVHTKEVDTSSQFNQLHACSYIILTVVLLVSLWKNIGKFCS